MNKLPNELILIIFSYLHLIDLFRNCKLACKRWRILVNTMKQFKELVINYNEFSNNYWHFNYRPIDSNSITYCNNLKDQSFKNHFSTLKYLKINFMDHTLGVEQLDYLSSLKCLEQLDLDFNLSQLFQPKLISLRLPNLKYLRAYFYQRFPKFQIDAINLSSLDCNYLKGIELVHPQSIKSLEFRIDNEFNNSNRFSKKK